MAVTANSYFSNAIVGVPQVGGGQDIYKEDYPNPKFAIGMKFERQDGAIFRYAHFGATVDSAGMLVAVDESESNSAVVTAGILESSSTYQMPSEQPGTYPNMKGSRYVVLTLASIQTDTYAGGYMTITSGPNVAGGTYRIKGNTKTDDPTSGEIRIELYDKLQVGMNSSTSVKLVGSRYANLEATKAATGTDTPSGVTMIKITSAGSYGWIQTRGICGVYSGESTILGNRMVGMSTEIAGAVDLITVDVQSLTSTAYSTSPNTPIVGFSCANGTAGTWVPIALALD